MMCRVVNHVREPLPNLAACDVLVFVLGKTTAHLVINGSVGSCVTKRLSITA